MQAVFQSPVLQDTVRYLGHTHVMKLTNRIRSSGGSGILYRVLVEALYRDATAIVVHALPTVVNYHHART